MITYTVDKKQLARVMDIQEVKLSETQMIKKVNRAVRDSNYSLYLICPDRNYRVIEAKKGFLRLIDSVPIKINETQRFMDGRTGQKYLVFEFALIQAKLGRPQRIK